MPPVRGEENLPSRKKLCAHPNSGGQPFVWLGLGEEDMQMMHVEKNKI